MANLLNRGIVRLLLAAREVNLPMMVLQAPGGPLHIFQVRGRAIGKGIYFPDIGIKNGINVHNFGIRNGTNFQDFGMKYKVGYTFSKIGTRNGYVFDRQEIWSSAPPSYRHNSDATYKLMGNSKTCITTGHWTPNTCAFTLSL